MSTTHGRIACAIGVALHVGLVRQRRRWRRRRAPAKIDAADTAWMISATGLVLMMSIPGLALFYCGMVRKKNVLATMAQSLPAPRSARCCGLSSATA